MRQQARSTHISDAGSFSISKVCNARHIHCRQDVHIRQQHMRLHARTSLPCMLGWRCSYAAGEAAHRLQHQINALQ